MFEKEYQIFEKKKPELLKTNSGYFAVIKEEELLGVYPTFQEAYSAGLKRWGNVEMLIEEVVEVKPIHLITRMLGV